VSSTRRNHLIVVLIATALLSAFEPHDAPAQSNRRNRRLSVLQQQNALLQQQTAVLSAVQQTTALVQSAQQNNVSPQGPVPNLLAFQQQQSSLAVALQQTNALLQVSYRQNNALAQTALRQLNTLQTAQQQTINLQRALLAQNGQLTPLELQTLFQEQSLLTQLLTAQPAISRGAPPR
jgi:hypothetical protein